MLHRACGDQPLTVNSDWMNRLTLNQLPPLPLRLGSVWASQYAQALISVQISSTPSRRNWYAEQQQQQRVAVSGGIMFLCGPHTRLISATSHVKRMYFHLVAGDCCDLVWAPCSSVVILYLLCMSETAGGTMCICKHIRTWVWTNIFIAHCACMEYIWPSTHRFHQNRQESAQCCTLLEFLVAREGRPCCRAALTPYQSWFQHQRGHR